MYLTEALAKYALDLDIQSMAPEIVRQAKLFFADGMACMIAGTREEPTKIAKTYAREFGGKPEASLIASNVKTDVMTAAMTNGIAAHYHDYDDVADSANAHVSVVMLPTVLAVGEALQATGVEVLEAYIVGIEVCSMAGRGMGKENFRRGWHSTASLGIFGAAAATGKLMKLNQKQITYALGIAASEASGLKANFGTMTKSFHAGSAASKGIRAARLAYLGFDSSLSCMEAKCGYADLTIGGADFSSIYTAIENETSEFIDPGMIMKPYPSCKATHNGIEAMLYLVKEHDLHPEDIDHVLAEVQTYALDLLRFPLAETKLQGKFSLNYPMAQMIIKRNLSLKDFDGEKVDDPLVIDLMKRMKVEANDNMNGGETMMVRGDTIVHVFTKDGCELVKRVNYAAGDPHAPLGEEVRMQKIKDCLSRNLVWEKCVPAVEAIQDVDRLPRIGALMEMIRDAAQDPEA